MIKIGMMSSFIAPTFDREREQELSPSTDTEWMWVCLQASLYRSEVSQSKVSAVFVCVYEMKENERLRMSVVCLFIRFDVFLALIFPYSKYTLRMIHDAVYVCVWDRLNIERVKRAHTHTHITLTHLLCRSVTVLRNDFWFLLYRFRLVRVSVNECDSYRRFNGKLKYCEIS